MSSDVKYLLGFVPVGVMIFLFLIGMRNYTSVLIGLGLILLYAFVVKAAKFYKTPPAYMYKPYYNIFYISAWCFLFCLKAIDEVVCNSAESMSMEFKAFIFGLLILIAVIFTIFPIRGGFIGIEGKPVAFVRRWGIYFIFALLPLFYICCEVLSVPSNLALAVFFWGYILMQYLMVKLALKLG